METITFKVDRMFRLEDAGTLKAFADLSVNDALVIRGVRVISGKKGLFVCLPREQGKDNKWYDQVVMKDARLHEKMSSAVLAHYQGEPE
ncbi:MAG: hypothetical protein GX606_02790 [Elusimicrobia bacterium]|nr:hypothetical protein [Elusimicrobiota bacterium]